MIGKSCLFSWDNIGWRAFVPHERYCSWERNGFEFNHKIIINVKKSLPSIMVTNNPMVCESLGKRLVIQGKDASPLGHSTWGRLHCCLIVFLCYFFIPWSCIRFKKDLLSWINLYLIKFNHNHSKVWFWT